MSADDTYLRLAAQSSHSATRIPLVSFCIPTRNRARTIKACLRSIRAQRYPAIEIIVIDNGSTDGTPELARAYADRVDFCPGRLGAVRQRSIDLSRGEILALFDDDIIIPHPDWLGRAVAAFGDDERVSTVWPALIPPPGASWVTRCFFDLNDAIFAARQGRPTAVFGGGNSLFRRAAVEAVGGFNRGLGFGEDFDLASRLKEAGYSVVLHRDPLIHDTMYSLREIYRKQRWGARAVAEHGAGLLAQSYGDAFHEQLVVGLRAMARGLLLEGRPWWLTYPLLLAAKGLPYSQALLARVLAGQQRGARR